MRPKKCIPNVKEYLDVHQYLQDAYASLKNANPRFSYMTWARGMGLQTKSYLRFAVVGQRGISPEMAQKMSEYFQFDGIDKEYFTLLVLYTQCEQKDQKKILGSRLLQLLKQDVQMAEADISQGVLAKPLAITIRTILSYSDISRTPQYLAKLLNITVEEVVGHLGLLEAEGLVARDKDEWSATTASLKMSDRSAGETLHYHKQCLLKAIEAQMAPSYLRHFRSLGLALSEEDYQSYLQNLDQFVKATFAKYDGDALLSKRIYQINFNLFPWTERAGDEGEAQALT